MGDALETVNTTTTPLVSNSGKSNAGRVIRIINNADHTVQVTIFITQMPDENFLLNMKATYTSVFFFYRHTICIKIKIYRKKKFIF